MNENVYYDLSFYVCISPFRAPSLQRLRVLSLTLRTMWQDIVILAGSIVAIASLIPTLIDENALVPHTTSIPTLIVLSGQSVAFYTLGLLGSAVGAGAGICIWSLIAYYKAPDDAALFSEGSLSHTIDRLRTTVPIGRE